MAISSLVSVRVPYGNEPTDPFSFQKLDVWTHFLDGAAINTDIRNSQPPDVAPAGIDNFAAPWIRQRKCHPGLNSSSQRRPAIGIETRRNVDGHNRSPGRIHKCDRVTVETGHSAF